MKNIGKIITYLFLSIAAFVSIFPFYWMIVSSTNTSVDVTGGRMLPGTHLLQNWQTLMGQVNFGQSFMNSLQLSLATTVLSLLIASLAGYGFEIYKSRAKDLVFNILLGSMMIPFAALMIPLFRMFANLSGTFPFLGLNTKMGVILPGLATAFLIFFFRQSTKMFPKDILEAGRIDGLSELGIFFKIYLPTMKTTYAAAAIITFMGSWNSYLWPLIMIQTQDRQTLPLLIANLGSSYAPDFGIIMLAIVITTLPVALVFFLLQKHFVAGMTGSVK
ncbi:MAG: carbohydrate ABC transporter permease [Turicibacter sp.]|nr:carbohydrate ABC transporter permease [Turicibacter sp.]